VKKLLFVHLLTAICCSLVAQKTVYIPTAFNTDPVLRSWSWSKSYQSANFVLFWGNVVGTNPTIYPDANLRFNPHSICDTLEYIYTRYINDIGFCSDAPAKNLGRYKIIIVMNDTWGNGGPTGWAFGGAYDGTIGAMWVHPNATRDGGVTSHEFAHCLQNMQSIQENVSGGGFTNYEPAGFFWECHANFMRCQVYPRFASDDLPRWMGTGMFHWSSTRHHYDNFKLLFYMQQTDGITMVNRLWQESLRREHPLETYRRLKGWDQEQLNHFMYDYVKREVTCDYTANNFGAIIRQERERLRTSEPHYLWRLYTMLTQLNDSTGRYIVPDAFAPQDYGYNIIPLYTTCANQVVHIKFKGHTEVNNTAGWRYGFVAVKADGVTVRYSPVYADNETEISFQLNADETRLYFVVMGAPVAHNSYAWEPGWPKIKRYPYELRIENALPEGYQPGFRSEYKLNGHTHLNGGGWVANTASVAASVYVGPRAMVLGNALISGQVHIDGTAWVEHSIVRDSVVIDGNANIWHGSYLNNAHVTGNAVLNNCTLYGNAMAKDNALEWGVTISNSVIAGGDAEIGNCAISGVYLQVPHNNNGRTNCDGKGATDTSNQDVNVNISPFTDEQMAFTSPAGCSDAALPITHHTLPIPKEVNTREISIYPNPVQSRFTMQLHHFSDYENPVLFIYDMQGWEIIKKDLKGGRTIQLNASLLNMRKGAYLIKVMSGKMELLKKMEVMD
jgi:hypothetical protein